MGTWTVLIAVAPSALSRVVDHLLADHPDVEVVGRVAEGGTLARRSGKLVPDLIIANARLLGRELAPAISKIRGSSPGSKVLVISRSRAGSRSARRFGADASLEEEILVRRLRSMVSVMVRAGHGDRRTVRGRPPRSRVTRSRTCAVPASAEPSRRTPSSWRCPGQ